MKNIFFLILLFPFSLLLASPPANPYPDYISFSTDTNGSREEVCVAHASVITDVSHQAVIETAIQMLPPHYHTQEDLASEGRGNFAVGTIFFRGGTYEISDQILVPGRTSLFGSENTAYGAGTVFKVVAGGDLTGPSASSLYVFRTVRTDGSNFNGSFNQNWQNFWVGCNGHCRGLLVAGAQCSKVSRVRVNNALETGIYVAGARPLTLESVQTGTITATASQKGIGIEVGAAALRLAIDNSSIGLSDIGVQISGDAGVLMRNVVFESINEICVEKTQSRGYLNMVGFSVQGGSSLTSNNGAALSGDQLLLRTVSCSRVTVSGAVRGSVGPKIWEHGDSRIVLVTPSKPSWNNPFDLTSVVPMTP